MTTAKNTIKNWFKNGKKPNQNQFWEWMDAYWHKDEKIPIEAINGLNDLLGGLATSEQLNSLAYSNASNLTPENIEAWKSVLGVDELPANIGLIDTNTEAGNVFTKMQVNDLLQVINDRLGLTETAISGIHDRLFAAEESITSIAAEFEKVGYALTYNANENKLILKNKNNQEIYSASLPIAKVGKTGNYDDLRGRPDLSMFIDLEEYDKLVDFPSAGTDGKIYLAIDTGYLYRWSSESLGYIQLTDQTAIWGKIAGSLEDQPDLKAKFEAVFEAISKLGFSLNYDESTEILQLLNEVGDKISETKIPSFNIDAWMANLPTDNSFGDHPSLIVKSGNDVKLVEVSTEGVFTDIRSFTSFIGGAIEGGSNIFSAKVRNVSTVSVNGLEVDIVLPKNGSDITYGTPNIIKPVDSDVSLVAQADNIFNFDISLLSAGETIEIQIPITWGRAGTYQASTLVKITDSLVIDYAFTDDYSTAMYRVAGLSEGTETIDCPLIEVTANGIQIPVYSSNSVEIGSRLFGVSEKDIIFETSVPVTVSPLSFTLFGDEPYIANDGDYVVRGVPKIGKNIRSEGFNLEQLSSSKFKISFKNYTAKVICGAVIELKVGLECKPQLIYFNTKYLRDSGDGIQIENSNYESIVGISPKNYIISELKHGRKRFYNYIDIDKGEQYDNVEFLGANPSANEVITLNLKSGVAYVIKLIKSDGTNPIINRLYGNIKTSFNATTKEATIEIDTTASSADNQTNGDVIFNFV